MFVEIITGNQWKSSLLFCERSNQKKSRYLKNEVEFELKTTFSLKLGLLKYLKKVVYLGCGSFSNDSKKLYISAHSPRTTEIFGDKNSSMYVHKIFYLPLPQRTYSFILFASKSSDTLSVKKKSRQKVTKFWASD